MAHIDLENGSQSSVPLPPFDSAPTTANDLQKLPGALSSPASSLDSFSDYLHFSGNKKALLIGVRVCQSDGYADLDMAHDDVYKMRDLLIEVYHYKESEITILLDDDDNVHTQPTRENILAAIAEFVKNVKAGDKLCFHYSGHSTQVKNPNSRSCSGEDGLDESLVPFDGENMRIVDNELHAALVQPLPAGSHLVAVLDTCNSGSLLDLKHYRCNRVSVPWKWRGLRGRRDSEPIRPINVGRRNARLVTLPQKLPPWLAPYLHMRHPIAQNGCQPSNTGTGAISISGRSTMASLRTSPLTRLRPGGKLSVSMLRTLSVSSKSSVCAVTKDPQITADDNWIEGEVRRCESPVGRCSGWCRNVEGRSTLLEDEDDVKADVVSLARHNPWEGDGVSMASVLVELLRENPERSLQDILIQISHRTYSLALSRHSRSQKYKAQRQTHIRNLMHQIKRLERGNRSTASLATPDTPASGITVRTTFRHATSRGPGPKKSALLRTVGKQIQTLKEHLWGVRQDKGYAMEAFQNPELSSPRPLDMNRPWRM